MYLSCPIFVAFVIDLRINRWRKVAGLDQGPGHAGGHENQQQQLPFFKQIMDVLWRIRQKHFCWFCCNGWSQKDRCRSQDVHIEIVWQDCKQASGKKSETNRKQWWLECKNCGGFIDLRSSQDAHYISHIDGGSNAQIARVVSEMHHKWCLKCTNCGDGSQMHHKTWMRLRGTLSGHTWWRVAHQTMNWNKKT